MTVFLVLLILLLVVGTISLAMTWRLILLDQASRRDLVAAIRARPQFQWRDVDLSALPSARADAEAERVGQRHPEDLHMAIRVGGFVCPGLRIEERTC